jgi:predicted dithiol-disulfide oxidoreductase (DUF899 family)
LTRLQDEVARERRALPWVRVDKAYVFDSPDGPCALADLFHGRRQLVIQHFMFAPGWPQGCPSCSFMADHVDAMRVHLAHRDVAWAAVSRATLAEIERFRIRMDWRFRWVSSHGNDFNRDFGVTFTAEEHALAEPDSNFGMRRHPFEEEPGISVFIRDDEGAVFRTYSTYARGVEVLMGTYAILDLVPMGRGERDVPYKMEWVRHHDRYAETGASPAGELAGELAREPALPPALALGRDAASAGGRASAPTAEAACCSKS